MPIRDIPEVVLYQVERGVKIALRTAAYGLIGSAAGMGLGLLTGDDDQENSEEDTEEDKEAKKKETRARKRSRLLNQLQMINVARQIAKQAVPPLASREFDIRRKLEALGYYPCRHCGVPHVDPDKDNCLPHGAYFSEHLQRYIHVGHPDWSEDEYQSAWGKAWDPNPPADSNGEKTDDAGKDEDEDEDSGAVH